MKLIAAQLKFILTSTQNHDVGKKKAIYFFLLAIWSFSCRDCQGQANNFLSADGDANKAEKTMNAK